jgi:hypothetical protein
LRRASVCCSPVAIAGLVAAKSSDTWDWPQAEVKKSGGLSEKARAAAHHRLRTSIRKGSI